MESTAVAPSQPTILYWLPYWAVVQTDVRQTLRGWVWRTWVLTSMLAIIGYMSYRFGVYREAKIVQNASVVMGDLYRWPLVGTALFVVLLSVGAIAGERGTLADSVLSRGISRYQFFLAKWHSRLAVVLATFAAMTIFVLIASHFLLSEGVSLTGGIMAIIAMSAVLTVIVTAGVTVGALTTNLILGVSVIWMLLYAVGFGMSFLPATIPSPDKVLTRLPQMLQGTYDASTVWQLVGYSAIASCAIAIVGLISFSRTDV